VPLEAVVFVVTAQEGALAHKFILTAFGSRSRSRRGERGLRRVFRLRSAQRNHSLKTAIYASTLSAASRSIMAAADFGVISNKCCNSRAPTSRLLVLTRKIAFSHTCSGRWLRSKSVPILTVKGLRHS